MISENEIEEVVKAFKSYITKVIRHTAIDYIRKVKSNKYTIVAFNENIDKAVSLSSYDEDTAFLFNENQDIFSNSNHNNVFGKLTKMQRDILILTAEGVEDKIIAEKYNITLNNLYVIRKRIRNKFKSK